jgi:hypothetical protein
MWTPTTRRQHSRPGLRYQTDLTDAEWAVIEPLMPEPATGGRPPIWTTRDVLNAIFYVLRGGVAIIGSDLVNSMNKNPEIADSFKVLAGFVQETGSDEAKSVLNELLKRESSSDDKLVRVALWEKLINLAPAVTSLSETFLKLSKHFS